MTIYRLTLKSSLYWSMSKYFSSVELAQRSLDTKFRNIEMPDLSLADLQRDNCTAEWETIAGTVVLHKITFD